MKKMIISKRIFILVTVCCFLAAFCVIALNGSKYTETFIVSDRNNAESSGSAEDYYVTVHDQGIVEITGVRLEGSRLKIDLRSLSRGTTFIEAGRRNEHSLYLQKVYVHRFGIITAGSYFGKCTGSFMIPLSLLIIFTLLYIDRIIKLRIEVRRNLYSYRNIMNFGLIVFMTFVIFELIWVMFSFSGIYRGISSVLSSAEFFAYIVLPVAAVVFVMVTLSNLNLMRKEGVNWHNMLGFILGLALCLMTVLPEKLYTLILKYQLINIFQEDGIGTQVYFYIEHTVFFILAYLECILLGTVVFGIMAARHIPAFDKDYILILGSKIKDDGTLTPLLKARADKALEFAKMQKESYGKDIVFVPSGGKGSDEKIAEADAIGEYLLSTGVPQDKIIIENRSVSTCENIRNSMDLIALDFESGKHEEMPKAAFSTTNYHVFRAGLIASELGYPMEGIGSPTKRYFWLNAFIREFAATLVSQNKRHLKVIGVLLSGLFVMSVLKYLSVIL